MTKLNTINCEEIMTEPLKPIEFVVDNLITQGLFILAGAPKMVQPPNKVQMKMKL